MSSCGDRVKIMSPHGGMLIVLGSMYKGRRAGSHVGKGRPCGALLRSFQCCVHCGTWNALYLPVGMICGLYRTVERAKVLSSPEGWPNVPFSLERGNSLALCCDTVKAIS